MRIRPCLTRQDPDVVCKTLHQTDLNQAEGLPPLGSSPAPGSRNYPQSQFSGEEERRTMNPSIQLKKATSPSGFSSPRAFMALLLCTAAAGSMLTGTMLAFFRPEAPAKVPNRTLTFADRVAYQRAIEEVYWRHRIWPKERPDPKPSLDEIIPPAQLEKKVMDYLRNSQALENYWQRPLTAEQLQAEMDRMAKHTKQPEMLQELFEALGNDPFVIAECLAKPVLSERLVTNFYPYDQRFHAEPMQRAEAQHQVPTAMAAVTANYTLPVIAESVGHLHRRHVDSNQHHQRARWPILPHGGLDRQRNDRLGRTGYSVNVF